MSIVAAGQPGPNVVGDGASAPLRTGRLGELISSELHPRYFESVFRGNSFSACNQATQAVSVALATTYTGFCLYNPVGSNKLLIPTKVKLALTAAPAAAASLGLITGFSATGGVTAQTTKLVPTSNFLGAPAGVGIALSAATLVTPTWLFQLYDAFTAAALPAPTLPIDLEGMFVIPPGAFIAIGALTAVTGFMSMAWEEIQQA